MAVVQYQVKRVIGDIISFVKTCPFLDEFGIDMSKISAQRFISSAPQGTALDYVGSNVPEDRPDILGGRFIVRQANFNLWFKAKSGHNMLREDIADFIFNFELWVEFCQHYNLVPKIGDTPIFEVMWADNGMYFSDWDGKETSLYQIQLHIIFQKEYIPEGEL